MAIQSEADVAIVGAGPIGIELAVAFSEIGISFLQFDKGQIAQTIFNYPPETRFFSSSDKIAIAGTPIQTVDQQKCSKENYLAYLRSIVLKHQLSINTYESVDLIEQDPDGKYILTTQSQKGEVSYRVKFVILATGGIAHPRTLGVQGENLPHVACSLSDPHKYFQKNIAIIGGKNSAAEAALRCFHAGAVVTMIIRKEQFEDRDVKYWILPELKSRINKGEISCHFGSTVKSIHNDHLLITNNLESQDSVIPTDFVLKAIGFEADNSLFQQVGISYDESSGRPQYDKETMESSRENVFILGTAIAGTQKRFRVYIENTHHHVQKICRVLCNRLNKEFSLSTWLDQLPEPDEVMNKYLEE